MRNRAFRITCALVCLLGAPALSSAATSAQEVLDATGVRGGVAVHLECGDGALTAELGAKPGFVVHGLDTDPAQVAKARANLAAAYGTVSVDGWDGKRLPYIDNFANLIVSEQPVTAPRAELLRALAPNGVAYTREGGKWTKIVKPRPANIDEWTHYFHDASGNPVAHDTQVGPPRRLQWVGGPRWARHHDHMASMTSLVAAGGRLFYIFDEGNTASIQYPSHWRLIARDAFNGTVLWKRKIVGWNTRQWPLKSGPAHLTRRLVAVGDRVYATLSLEAPTTALDAASGNTLLTYAGSERTREILVTGGALLAVVGLDPSRLPEFNRQSTYVWDNTRRANRDWAWGGAKRRIMAFDAESGKPLWSVEAPVAPCSLASDGKRVIYYDGQKVACLDHKT
ncbi:PQQ-binding-like beta-propeller repeat protein, partial [bacterium]|nr:PQQ-binding-like beta-propeller repeat protein [bacterium]